MARREDDPRESSDLLATHAHLRVILESPGINIFSLDRAYRYTSFNGLHARTMRAIWGAEIEFGRCMLDYIKEPGDLEKARRNFDEALSGREFTLVEAYGDEALERTSFEDRYSPVATPEGEIVGLTVLVTDVTARIQAEEQRRELEIQTQKAASLDVLAGGIADEFNDLVVTILSAAEVALGEPVGVRIREALELIETSAQRASELTRQLLAYSGRGRFHPRPVDLAVCVRDMRSVLEASVGTGVSLSFEVSAVPPTDADGVLVRQVVLSLVLNACDALADRPGQITVRTRVLTHADEELREARSRCDLEAESYACIEVADTGPGLTPEDRRRVFDPFFAREAKGRGLGLAASLGIMRGHRGFLVVTSTPGQGSVFLAGFPVSSHASPSPAPDVRSASSSWVISGTVLVVDDEAAVRGVLARMLQRLGLQVVEATDGEGAVRVFRERVDDLVAVLLDRAMPTMSGTEVFAQIAAIRPDVPVIMMSGAREPTGDLGFAARPAAFLAKPFRIADLTESLRIVLGRSRGP